LEQKKFQNSTNFVPDYDAVPFSPSRLADLRSAKGIERKQLATLAGVSLSQDTKHENGDAHSSEMIERFAEVLDCTLDYLFDRGANYSDPLDAAVRMSFDVFARSEGITVEQLERCRRVIGHAAAPATAAAWKALSEQIQLAIGPSGSGGRLLVVEGGRR
jgi:transcriptional regulator with XRE-family HTH domain